VHYIECDPTISKAPISLLKSVDNLFVPFTDLRFSSKLGDENFPI